MSLQGWYPLALSRDIEPSTSAGTRVEGQEIVVWRDDKGAAHVWEDRCPHRGMKMSFGFVRGDHLACLYHGWQYDTAGQCRHIPAHPDLDVPATIRIPRYAVAEAGAIVWGRFDTEEGYVPAPPSTGEVTPLCSIFADCPASLMADRLTMTSMDGIAPQVTDGQKRWLAISLGEVRLIAGIQPVSETEAALHLTVEGISSKDTLKQLTIWTAQLRRDLEEAAAAAAGAEIAA